MGFRRTGFSPVLALLVPALSLAPRPWLVVRATSPCRATLSYHIAVRRFGEPLSPVHYRRGTPRPVSYYALFKWWLLLSQHPGCHGNSTSFRTEWLLGTLADGLGCSPLDDEAYPSPSNCRSLYMGIRSLVARGSRVGPPAHSVALPPMPTTTTLTLELFRRERAISTFDDTFNPPHRSSPSFSTLVSSDLHEVLPSLHPAHA